MQLQDHTRRSSMHLPIHLLPMTEENGRIDTLARTWSEFVDVRKGFLRREHNHGTNTEDAALVGKMAAQLDDLETQTRLVAHALAWSRSDPSNPERYAVAASLVGDAMALVPGYASQRKQAEALAREIADATAAPRRRWQDAYL